MSAQPLNAIASIIVTLAGISITPSAVQPTKAPSSISTTFSGITTSPDFAAGQKIRTVPSSE